MDEEIPKNHRKQLEDEIDLDDVFDAERIKNEQLPIFPPIILLDFVNGTDDSFSNANSDGDEKSKRTIDGSLGYGFDRNNLFSGAHNFYFPGGKGATSVSIEESISPFEPKTVTEIEKPITEDSDADIAQEEQKSRKTLFEKMPEPLPLQNSRDSLPLYPPHSMFGQRTKLHKTSSSEFNQQFQRPQTRYPSSFSATPGSEIYNKLITAYASFKPIGHQGTSYSNPANIQSYVRPMTSSYVASYMSDAYGSGSSQKTSYNFQSSPGSLSSEIPINPQDIASYPKYTTENGIKYEHKIVWKYPDGKISEMPPTSYMNSYSEYANSAKTGSFRPSAPYQTLPHATQSQQPISPGTSSYNQYTSAAQANLNSQKPIQFPTDQETPNNSQQPPSTGYVSSATVDSAPTRYTSGVSSYNPQNYQGQYGLRQSPKIGNYRPTSEHYSAYPSHYRPVSGYGTNNPHEEYPFSGTSQSTKNLFMSNGQLNKQVLAKYTPQAQEYLAKVFANGKTKSKPVYQNEESKNYPNTDYSSLLNYNPSISQYIKNPASILKAQPTFIQAGDSLIPVIILRVDGAPPVQPQSNSNINLKSLLRQYLTQYANSVSKFTQNFDYNLGSSVESASNTNYRVGVSPSQSNPVQDLKELTETLASLRQRGHQDPDFATNLTPEYTQPSRFAQKQNSQNVPEYTNTNYNYYQQRSTSEQQVKKPMKVKNVQIIEDPRYTSYKVEN